MAKRRSTTHNEDVRRDNVVLLAQRVAKYPASGARVGNDGDQARKTGSKDVGTTANNVRLRWHLRG